MAWLKTVLSILISQTSQNVTKDSNLRVDSESCRSSESGTEHFSYCFGQPNTCPVNDVDQQLTMMYNPPENCEQKRINDIATHDKFKGTCSTPECLQASARILQAMNQNADPCDDFYEFACGSYVKSNKIPSDRRKISRWDTARDATFSKLKFLLRSTPKNDELKVLKYPKLLYKSCMNLYHHPDNRSESMLRDIMKKVGGWPVLEDKWKNKNDTWDQFISFYRGYGYDTDYFMKFTFKTLANQYVELRPASLGIGSSFLLASSNITENEYYKYMVRVAVAFGAKEQKAKKELKDAFNLEVLLAKASALSGTPGFFTVSVLEKMFPAIPWLQYINNIITPEHRYYETSEVFLENPVYIIKLQEIISNSSRKAIVNYLTWRVVADSLPYLPIKYKTLSDQFYDAIGYKSVATQRREDFCAYAVNERMPIATRALLINSELATLKKDKILVTELALDIKNVLYNRAASYLWMSKSTQDRMKELLNKLDVKVSYPIEVLLKPVTLENFYKDVVITNNSNFLESMLNLTKFYFRYKLVKKPWENKDVVGCDLYESFADNPKVKWSFCGNIIEITAPAVREFYSSLQPGYINYGNIASTVAYQMLRSIQQQPWWTVADKTAFKSHGVCYLQNYDKKTTKEFNFKIDAKKTFDNNIMDLSAANFAFQAYERWIYKQGGDQKLIGLDNYTPKQLFWISYASSRCTKYSKKELLQITTKKKTMPMRERVNLPLQQLWEFSRDFNCPKNSKMNLDMSVACSSIW